MNDRTDAKAACRAEMKSRLRSIDARTRGAAATELRDRVLQRVRTDHITSVMAFLSDDLEIDLDPTIEALLAERVAVGVPVVEADRGSMAVARLRSLAPDTLDRDRYGLRRPRTPLDPIAPASLDLILVPGLAFSRRGRRLGRGGGYYDRFLATLPYDVRRLGVAFDLQTLDDLPCEPHDAAVDELIVIRTDSSGGSFSTD